MSMSDQRMETMTALELCRERAKRLRVALLHEDALLAILAADAELEDEVHLRHQAEKSESDTGVARSQSQGCARSVAQPKNNSVGE